MKKYILAVALFLSFVSVGFCNTDLSKLAGKQIYRDVPVNSKSFFSKEYMNIKYELHSYSDTLLELKQLEGIEYGKKIVLFRSLWDDGNWKEYTIDRYDTRYYFWSTGPASKASEFYDGEKVWDVLRGRGIVEEVKNGNDTMSIKVKLDTGLILFYHENGSYDDKEVRRLYPIETKSINFTLEKLFPEKKQERLLVRELIGTETFHTIHYAETEYNCVRCGKSLVLNPVGYYCLSCKTGFHIEKGE